MIEQNKTKKQRKITLRAVGLIVLVVIAVSNIYVWKNNETGKARAAALNDNIAAVQSQIKAVPEPAAGLESQLEAVKAKLADVQSGFPVTVERNEVIGYIIDLAEEYHVQILPLVSDGWAQMNAGQTYDVLEIAASAEGSLGDIKQFITALQTGRYPTLTITDFSIERTSAGIVTAPADNMEVKVTMRLGVFTFTPVQEESVP